MSLVDGTGQVFCNRVCEPLGELHDFGQLEQVALKLHWALG